MSWSFKKVEIEDSAKILEWRNNPEIYRYLFNPFPVEKKDHEAWMSRLKEKVDVFFFMARLDGVPAGTVRFDFNKEFTEAEIGIYLAPEFHGKGLSSLMLAESEKMMKKEVPVLKRIVAKVLLENVASKKMFQKTDYKEISVEENYVVLEKLLEICNDK